MRRLAGPLAALLAAALVACGAPAALSESDGVELDRSRERIVAALATERRLSESPATAARLVARVRDVVSQGSLEGERLDEFGLAALGELHLAVPALAIVDRQEIPRRLDREALTVFLAEAGTDPTAAMRPAAASETRRIARILAASGAGPDTEIPVAEMTADVYLADLGARLRPVWPALAAELAATRSRL